MMQHQESTMPIGSDVSPNPMPGSRRPRVLLLVTATTYRTKAFIVAGERAGIDVVLATDMSQQLASYWHEQLGIDFSASEQAITTIENYALQHPIDAVLAVDDSGTELAARVGGALGLQHASPEAAAAARDKYVMRALLQRAAVPSPHSQLFDGETDPHVVATMVNYPCVVKPRRLSGSRGVIRADNPAECCAAIERLLRLLRTLEGPEAALTYLVEDFVPGFEVALEGLLDAGRLHLLALFDKPDPLDGPFFEETLYVTPSRLRVEVQETIRECAAKAAAAIGLLNGPMHAELRINDAGPWIVELAGRSIGGLCSQTLRFGVDMSLEELILRQACGLPFSLERADQRAGGVMMIPIPGEGMLTCVTGIEDALAVPGVEEVEVTAHLHYPIVPLPEGDSYLGFIFARGATPQAAEQALREAHRRLGFTIKPRIRLSLGL